MFVIRGRRIVLPDGERAAAIHIDHGQITAITDFEATGAAPVVDADALVIPGLVDTHVHVNEPGRSEWEGFDTATRAAAAGGITTIVDMPLNSIPPTIDVPSLTRKRAAARGRVHVDVAFWGGIVPGNERAIEPLIEAGVRGFKCFLTPSGVDEFQPVTEADLRQSLPIVARAPFCPVLVHAEDPSRLAAAEGDPRVYATYAASRPAAAEVAAVQLSAALAAEYDVAAHIVHLSSSEGVATVERAQTSGVRLSAETCPHYLAFCDADVADGATVFKCAPPIRSAEHREALWHALRRGVCSLVVSDHSPAPATVKCVDSGNFVAAWGGIGSIELTLAAVWTGAAARGFSIADVVTWMSREPAKLCGLSDRKGRIAVGCDADLVFWDPDAVIVVDGERLQQRHKLTPYDGRSLRGVVRATYLRGVKVWDETGLAAAGRGTLL